MRGRRSRWLWDKEAALAPNDSDSLETRAEIREKLGQRDEAIADDRAALTFRHDNQPAKDGLARLTAAK